VRVLLKSRVNLLAVIAVALIVIEAGLLIESNLQAGQENEHAQVETGQFVGDPDVAVLN